jgi:hypothetical protein
MSRQIQLHSGAQAKLGSPESIIPAEEYGFRVRLRFATAPRNDKNKVRWLHQFLAAVLLAIIAGSAASPVTSFAADPRYPDWPCRQIKVPELSVAAIWAGPPIDDVGTTWENDIQIRDLVARVSARRTPIEEAEKAVTDFLAADPKDKQARAKLLFAGVFSTLNNERTDVMNGIERFSKQEKAFAEQIRSKARQVRELEDDPKHDQAKLDELGNAINWDRRIFEERRKTIGYVCEVPTVIEQRLGALARAIQQSLE